MRPDTIAWHNEDTEEELGCLYKSEKDPEIRPRLQALWLLRRGKSRVEVCDVVGVTGRALRNWIAWYRQGGVAEVRRHRKAGHGHAPRLSDEQCEEIKSKAGEGEFRVIEDVRVFVEENWGIHYSYWGMRSVLDRLKIHQRVPRPVSSKADLEAQQAWKKGGWPKPSR